MAANDDLLNDGERQVLADPNAYRTERLRRTESDIAGVQALKAIADFATFFDLSQQSSAELLQKFRLRVPGMEFDAVTELGRLFNNIAAISADATAIESAVPDISPNTQTDQQSALPAGSIAALAEGQGTESPVKAKATSKPAAKAASKKPLKPRPKTTTVPSDQQTTNPETVDTQPGAEGVLNTYGRSYLLALTGRSFNTAQLTIDDAPVITRTLMELRNIPEVTTPAAIERVKFYEQVLLARFKNLTPAETASQMNKKVYDVNNALFSIKKVILDTHTQRQVTESLNEALSAAKTPGAIDQKPVVAETIVDQPHQDETGEKPAVRKISLIEAVNDPDSIDQESWRMMAQQEIFEKLRTHGQSAERSQAFWDRIHFDEEGGHLKQSVQAKLTSDMVRSQYMNMSDNDFFASNPAAVTILRMIFTDALGFKSLDNIHDTLIRKTPDMTKDMTERLLVAAVSEVLA